MQHTYYSGNRSAKKISLTSLDPCLGIGLLIKNKADLEQVQEAFGPGSLLSKVITLYEKQPS